MLNSGHLAALSAVTAELFQKSSALFWAILPLALLLALLSIYVSGEISGAKLEGLFRRLFIAIALIVAFPEVSRAIQGLEGYLVASFGGEESLSQVFSALGTRASHMKDEGAVSWLKIGQIGLNIITTLSFLILALIRRFLDMLHLSLWNLLHVLGPLALLGCLFPTFVQVPKGIFMGMLELSLWKPVWIILARLLIAAGFGEEPQDLSRWFDTAVLNFTVAGLMATTPILVHAFLSGALGAMGGSLLQTMVAGTGALLTAQPMRVIQSGGGLATRTLSEGAKTAYTQAVQGVRAIQNKRRQNNNQQPKKTR